MLAGIRDKSEVECQVVYACNLHGQQFLSLEEVVQVSLRVYAVYVAAIRVDRREVSLPFLVPHVHCPLVCEEHGVASVSCRHDAVEHVYPSLDGFKDILRCAHPH